MCNEIFLDAPNVGELEKKYVCEAIDTGYVSTVGPLVGRFEEKFASFLGIGKAVSIQSGTEALHIALYELGIGPGDEVIVPALTFIATVNPVLYVGAKPVFVDVDRQTWNIDPAEIKKKIAKNTKAIIPVHFYGNPCDMDEIMQIAKKHGLYVIEDTTESLGAKYRGKYTGTFGDMGCFSFNGNKIITTSGGGMVVGRDQKRLEHIRFLVNQARDAKKGYYHPEVGFNYRMTNLEAAMGFAQMERLNEFLENKRAFNEMYRNRLSKWDFVRFQEEYESVESSCWFTSITLDNGVDIDEFQEKLRNRNIPTRRVFMPLTEFPPYKKYRTGKYENAYCIYEKGLCLPGSTLNSLGNIEYVCQVLNELLRELKR